MAKILMVDDDREFLEATKTLLESQGHEVRLAGSVVEAEEALKKQKPQLIFLDIMMEQEDDGIALARKWRKEGVKIPIVILSAVGKVTGYDYGKNDDVLPCYDFLKKPIGPKEFLDKVNAILNKT